MRRNRDQPKTHETKKYDNAEYRHDGSGSAGRCKAGQSISGDDDGIPVRQLQANDQGRQQTMHTTASITALPSLGRCIEASRHEVLYCVDRDVE